MNQATENLDEHLPDEEPIDGGLGVLVRRKMLYHGSSTGEIDRFQKSEETTLGEGVYFTSEPEKASGYAMHRAKTPSYNKTMGTSVRNDSPAVHIRLIENLKLLDLRNKENLLVILPAFKDILVKELDKENRADSYRWNWAQVIETKIEQISLGHIFHPKDIAQQLSGLFTDYVKSLGYDGVLALEGGEGKIGDHDTYLIFDPDKIKDPYTPKS